MLRNDYSRIEKAILFLDSNFRAQPSLREISRSVNLSEHHFQRLFRRWAGISPKRFLQYLTAGYAKELLRESRSVLDVTYESGLSSPGRLHDLFVHVEAVTPGEFKRKGAGLGINYGFHWSPFGLCLLATTERGICALSFLGEASRDEQALANLKSRWPGADLLENPAMTECLIDQIFPRTGRRGARALGLFLRGTNFQIKVWEALLKIPMGCVVSYEDIAVHLHRPGATRAVGSAVSRNPIAFLIPCHRVIRKIGVVGDYHWGAVRKKAMLGWEAARTHPGDGIKLNAAATA